MLPTVNFCGFETTRLLIGANPFAGFSHQNKERDEAMRAYHTPERILETWERAWKAGINTFVTNNETPHVVETVRRYLANGGPMRWIAQVSFRTLPSMEAAIEATAATGCRMLYFHGGLVDDLSPGKMNSRSGNGPGSPMDSASRSGWPATIPPTTTGSTRWTWSTFTSCLSSTAAASTPASAGNGSSLTTSSKRSN